MGEVEVSVGIGWAKDLWVHAKCMTLKGSVITQKDSMSQHLQPRIWKSRSTVLHSKKCQAPRLFGLVLSKTSPWVISHPSFTSPWLIRFLQFGFCVSVTWEMALTIQFMGLRLVTPVPCLKCSCLKLDNNYIFSVCLFDPMLSNPMSFAPWVMTLLIYSTIFCIPRYSTASYLFPQNFVSFLKGSDLYYGVFP